MRTSLSGLSSGLRYKFLLSLEGCLLHTRLSSRRDAIWSVQVPDFKVLIKSMDFLCGERVKNENGMKFS